MEEEPKVPAFKAPLGRVVHKPADVQAPESVPALVENKSATAKEAVFGLSHLEVKVLFMILALFLLLVSHLLGGPTCCGRRGGARAAKDRSEHSSPLLTPILEWQAESQVHTGTDQGRSKNDIGDPSKSRIRCSSFFLIILSE